MNFFVYSGKIKIPLWVPFGRISFFKSRSVSHLKFSLRRALTDFSRNRAAEFSGKRVGLIVPDHTREFHARQTLVPLARALEKICARLEIVIALGLHRALSPRQLRSWLGADFVSRYRVRQHNSKTCLRLGTCRKVPVVLNSSLRRYDLLFTLGVVEPHLYAGFSGGIKGIVIGLAGEQTILKTHSVKFLSQRGVQAARVQGNPFQRFLWEAAACLPQPVYSLNLVNDLQKHPVFFTLGAARPSFEKAVAQARRVYGQRVSRPFDLVLVGCDFPKNQSFYQASRLFNFMQEKKPVVRRGGSIAVFADCTGAPKSRAEENFERALAKALPGYAFAKPGEHRAFKIFQAARRANLLLIRKGASPSRRGPIQVLPGVKDLWPWIRAHYGTSCRVGVIPLGFSFIPV